jgi:hypothetical protein
VSASKRLYVAMAKTISYHASASPEAEQVIDRLVRDLCHDLKQDNMAFKRETFIEACAPKAQ